MTPSGHTELNGAVMKWSWHKTMTLVVVLTIVYVFVSPVLTLGYSANRAWHAALQVMLAIAFLAVLLFAIQETFVLLALVPDINPLRGSPDPLLLTSISRC